MGVNLASENVLKHHDSDHTRCPKFRKTSPSTIKNPSITITKITENGLSQLNFERPFTVIFVIVKHMCAQLEDVVRILRACF